MSNQIKKSRNLAELFVRVFEKIKIESRRHLCEEIDITPSQFTALKYLNQHDSNLLSDLAEGLLISNAAVTKMTDRLEKKGLVKRVNHAGDRRATVLKLTALGKELVSKATQAETNGWKKVIDRMSETQRDALMQGIQAFIKSGLIDIRDYNEICLKCGIEHQDSCPLECTAKEKQDNLSPLSH
ncbi:MarR family transcriptional regulator [Peptococcaceae bacterium 1198_IL3148]